MTLKREFRDRWVAALRSGKYEQGTRWLLRDNKYCCLGVAYCVEGEKPSQDRNHGIFEYVADVMPTSRALNGWGLHAWEARTLSGMNDKGIPFPEIADYIETLPVES